MREKLWGRSLQKTLIKNIHMDATVRYEFEEVSETNNFGLFVNDEKMATWTSESSAVKYLCV